MSFAFRLSFLPWLLGTPGEDIGGMVGKVELLRSNGVCGLPSACDGILKRGHCRGGRDNVCCMPNPSKSNELNVEKYDEDEEENDEHSVVANDAGPFPRFTLLPIFHLRKTNGYTSSCSNWSKIMLPIEAKKAMCSLSN